MPAPGPATAAQFRVINMGGNVVALNSIAYPQFFLGIDNGRLMGKTFDTYCHFYIHETPDHYVSLESCMLPGQHIGVDHHTAMTPPASTPKNDQAFFEVKLLVCRWPGHETSKI
ncbi:uncharacterized protein LOC116296622 [Actinia tenebrosa]|uniref:Uncharacterized protein LOC116296622 n=1 Tax=Actinia tenebrosa TaxID=6105 RepID=A0A6P8HYP9_ACTTE|nr:uncharacterized protein LOC116296622 [Actinia tenebrosa]